MDHNTTRTARSRKTPMIFLLVFRGQNTGTGDASGDGRLSRHLYHRSRAEFRQVLHACMYV